MFTPLVYSGKGGMTDQAIVFYKNLIHGSCSSASRFVDLLQAETGLAPLHD